MDAPVNLVNMEVTARHGALSGAHTIAQDENSSVVWGMPGEAVKLGCVDNVLTLSSIPKKIVRLLGGINSA